MHDLPVPWTKIAATARKLIPSSIDHGRRQAVMTEIASGFGLTRQSLRNILAAEAFMQRIRSSGTDTVEYLSRLPYTAVEIYARWHEYDPEASLNHARRAAFDGLSVKMTIAAEKMAREHHRQSPPSLGRQLERWAFDRGRSLDNIRGDVLFHLSDLGGLSELKGWSVAPTRDEYSKSLGVSEVIAQDGYWPSGELEGNDPGAPFDILPPRGIGIVPLGERSVAEGYRKQSRAVMAKAIAGSLRFGLVIVVAPSCTALRELTAVLPPPLGHDATGARPPLITLRRGLGALLFTQLETLGKDLLQ